MSINTKLIIEKIDLKDLSVNTTLSFKVENNGREYYSNEITRQFYQSDTEITAVQTANKEGEYVENGDEIIFEITMKNNGSIKKNIEIEDEVPQEAEIKDSYLLMNGTRESIDISEGSNYIDISKEINPSDEIKLIIKTEINIQNSNNESITNYATLLGNRVDIKTNEITYKIKKDTEDNDTDKEDDNQNGQRNEDKENSDNIETNKKTYTISGIVWVDNNKNGVRDENEAGIGNTDVELLDASTGNRIENDGKIIKTTTDDKGKYTFEQLDEGSYIVIFKYDSGKYRVTEYRGQGVDESLNSDVISKNIILDGQNVDVAITGTLNLKDSSLSNVDAGFIQNEKFDLKLDKYISKVILQNSTGTTTRQYENTQLAKIEIDRKQIENSTVIIEYLIKVSNEGDLAGYANEIIDYIPPDLTFNSELNKNWYQSNNRNLITTELTNEIIRPNESKVITLTMMKKLNQNNTGTVINTAELGKISNDFSIADIDSISSNKNLNEDDISIAQVIISIKTGDVITYITLIISMILIVGIGIYFIKKKVIIKQGI